MTNAANTTIAWQAKYDPFGASVTVTASPTNNQRLPGQWFQIEDGLAYNWHRTYDPTLGRYTQPDPLGFVDGPSLYGYGLQSPIVNVDPTGLFVGRPHSPYSSISCSERESQLWLPFDNTARNLMPPVLRPFSPAPTTPRVELVGWKARVRTH
jgi:RHS repeat-associated protein